MYRRNSLGGLSGGIVLLGVALAFVFGAGSFSLPVFFVALAFSVLIGSISSGNPRGAYGGLYGFFWLLILALFFITHSWIVFLIGAAISAILSALARPILAGLFGMGIFGAANMANRQPPPYQPYQTPPPQQPYQSYQEGYQPPPPQQPETYREGGQQYPYPQQAQPQYDQPQAQYPQELPPQHQ